MMLDLAKHFKKTKSTNKLAKERLKLVLIHDRSDLSPDFLDMVKGEIIKVIENYMDVDEETLDIQLTRTRDDDDDKIVPALIANIPIKGMKRSGR